MKANSGKSHISFSGNDNVSANIDDHTIICENKNELIGIILDSKLTFEDHINNLCKKASQKLNALARIAPYGSIYKISQVLATEMFEVKNNIAPETMKELFVPKISPYTFVITIRLREGE